MADPLSFAASIIAVASLAGSITSTISKLMAIYKLPSRLHAINNEVADLAVVLHQVGLVVTERKVIITSPEQDELLPNILQQADKKLLDLKEILDRLTKSCVGSGKFVARARAWHMEKPKLEILQQELHAMKTSLNIMLGASHSRDMIRVTLDLQSISLVASEISESNTMFQHNVNQTLQQNQQVLNQRLEAFERMLFQQFSQLQDKENSISEIGAGFQGNNMRRPKPKNSAMLSKRSSKPTSDTIGGISIRATQFTGRMCGPQCSCNCHARHDLRSPDLIGPILGRLFVGYSGMPRVRRQCNNVNCKRKQASCISIEYWFPLWFLAQIVKILIAYQPGAGPQLQMRMIRRVPDSAPAVTFALNGNIEGIKALFAQGLASPYDVSESRNFTLLRWAVYAYQFETCKFLVEAGADPQDEDPRERSSDRMWDLVLQGALTDSEHDVVRCMLDRSDYIEDRKIPLIPKIVLGMSFQNLEKELTNNPRAVSAGDIEGRTALHWAAARGDELSIKILLSHRADPGVMDRSGRTPAYLAAREGRTSCLRLLLEAGASPNPVSPRGTPPRSSPLVCAADANNENCIKTLLEFGADLEARTPDGDTPLIAIIRRRPAAPALVLMKCGANINAQADDGKTPLTAAVAYNNHGVLRVLINGWDQSDERLQLAGLDLLKTAADYADLQTINILLEYKYLKLHKETKPFPSRTALERIRARSDASEDILLAFEELLYLASDELVEEDDYSCLESGLQTRDQSNSSGSNSIDEVFHDATDEISIKE